MGVKNVHPSIDNDSEATDSDEEEIMTIMPPRHHMMVKV